MQRPLLLILGTALFAAAPALANEPSAKSTAVQSGGTVMASGHVSTQILSASIKAPNAKELAIDLSVQCGLYTYTEVKGKNGQSDTATAGARVILDVDAFDSDGNKVPVSPESAVFCERQQQLDATLGGVIENLEACTGLDPTADCLLSDEEIALGLKTLNANAYNFFIVDLPGSDVYTITATVVLDSCDNGVVVRDPSDPFFEKCSDGNDPDADAAAFINGASMLVQEIRFAD